LTPDQRTRVDSIVGRQVTQVHAIWEEMRPRMDSIINGARSEIERTLTPEQRKKFSDLRERRRMGRGGGVPGVPGGPPPDGRR
jgi:Spy/CpxP family protein refolding chaperone